jgi:hypothetical protein
LRRLEGDDADDEGIPTDKKKATMQTGGDSVDNEGDDADDEA